MEMELKKMPKRKPPPLPNPRTPQSPDAAMLIARALTPMFRTPMLGTGRNQPTGPKPMVVPRNNKRGRR
jgi:hypothetical protein